MTIVLPDFNESKIEIIIITLIFIIINSGNNNNDDVIMIREIKTYLVVLEG